MQVSTPSASGLRQQVLAVPSAASDDEGADKGEKEGGQQRRGSRGSAEDPRPCCSYSNYESLNEIMPYQMYYISCNERVFK